MIKIIISLLVNAILIMTIISPVMASDLIDYYNTGDDASWGYSGVNWIGQTFTTIDQYQLEYLKLKIYRSATSGTITVSIRETSGGLPVNGDLTAHTFNATDLTTSTAGEWFEIILDESVLLDYDSTYAIIIRATNNYGYWRRDTTDPSYSGGSRISSGNSGASWTATTTNDFMFECYGTRLIAPDGVISITSERIIDDQILIQWQKSNIDNDVILVAGYTGEYLTGYTTRIIYFGGGDNFTMFTMPYYAPVNFTIWESNLIGISGAKYNYLGGETLDVNVTMGFPLAYIGIVLGFLLIFVNSFLKSPIVWIAALVCFIGVYFEPDIFDTYYQIAVGIIMLFCLLMCTFHYKAKRYGG